MNAPFIENSIPAFESDGIIKIPFILNRSTSIQEIQKIDIKILSALSRPLEVVTLNPDAIEINDKYILKFKPSNTFIPMPGQFYQFQIRFYNQDDLDAGTPPPYSTAAVGKCISQSDINIVNTSTTLISALSDIYIGELNYNTASTLGVDKIEKYRFYIIDKNNQVLDTTEWQYHNQDQDTNFTFRDSYRPKITLSSSEVYTLVYEIYTVNQFYKKISALISDQLLYNLEPKLYITPEVNSDNGYVKLTVLNDQLEEDEALNGIYYITRMDNSGNWKDLFSFKIYGSKSVEIIKKDFIVENGKTYKYAIQRENSQGIRTIRRETEEVFCNFEHMFLCDSEKQLCIKFSPTVSQLKNTIQEQKIETAGSQYPFFVRNGIIKYKEFPLGGKISYLMDDEHLFLPAAALNLSSEDEQFDENKISTTNLTAVNIEREKIFKLAVLDWLNNGEPKLLKSSTEGTYIVRIMNVSMSPEVTLGRMIHFFTATAYEIDSFSYENCDKYNILDKSLNLSLSPYLKDNYWNNKIIIYPSKENIIKNYYIDYFKIKNVVPGSTLVLKYENGIVKNILIGLTGQYEIPTIQNRIYSIQVINKDNTENNPCEILFHGYLEKLSDDEKYFEKIKSLKRGYFFKTFSSKDFQENISIIEILLNKKNFIKEKIRIEKVKIYIEDYENITDHNCKLIINSSEKDLQYTNLITLQDVDDIIYPSLTNNIRTECYYYIEEEELISDEI